MTIRARTYQILQPAQAGDVASRVFDGFLLGLIAANVLSIVLESVRDLRQAWAAWFGGFEVASVIVFTAEYVLRLWTCVEDPRYARPVAGRLRAAASPLLLIDLLAIAPFYLPFVGVDLRFLRALRLFRVFRVAKLARYSQGLQTLGRVIAGRRSELAVAAFAMFLLMVLASILMYYVENDAQPEAFSSVPQAMWWAAATMTTVGYGDVYPVTPLGKALGAFIAVLGIAMIAVPTGILGAGFTEEMTRRHAPAVRCPHCGKELPRDGRPPADPPP